MNLRDSYLISRMESGINLSINLRIDIKETYCFNRLLLGGVKSGFRKVDFTIKPALFQVKGKRNPIVKQVINDLKKMKLKNFNNNIICL
jgi:hypothetical protein